MPDLHFSIRRTGRNPGYPWQIRFVNDNVPYQTSVRSFQDALWVVDHYFKHGVIFAYPEAH